MQDFFILVIKTETFMSISSNFIQVIHSDVANKSLNIVHGFNSDIQLRSFKFLKPLLNKLDISLTFTIDYIDRVASLSKIMAESCILLMEHK